ncbi:MAG: glycosyltransferase [bacterium]
MSGQLDEQDLVWVSARDLRSRFIPLNLRFIRRYRPELAPVIESAFEQGDALYGYRQGQQGIRTLRFRCGDSWSVWFEEKNPSTPDLVRSAKEAVSGADLIYLAGCGLGTVASGVFERIQGQNKGLFIIEPSVEFLLATLAARDLRSLISSKQVFFAAGPGWREQIYEVMGWYHLAASATPTIRPAIEPSSAWGQAILPRVVSTVQQAIGELQPRLKNRLDRFIASRQLSSRRPGRVLWAFQDSRGIAPYSLIQTVLLRSLFYHLTRLGWTVRYTHLRDGAYYPPYYRIWELERAKPDILFFCNVAPAFEFALGPELRGSLRIPKVIWHADDPFYSQHLYLRHGTGSDEFYLAADHGWIDQLRRYGAGERVGFMPGGATVRREGKRSRGFSSDIVFVGQVRPKSSFLQALSPQRRDHCERIVVEKLANPRVSLSSIMSRHSFPGKPLEEDLLDELRHRILWEANTRNRLEIVRHLEDLGLVIYGNSAWLERLPPGPNRDRFRGTIPFKKLPLVYRNATITLNIHSLQTYTCLNVRDFDVPASGGFLLSDWLPRVEDLFVPGLGDDLPPSPEKQPELFFYRNPEELRTIAAYFLENPDQRLPVIERGRSHVIRSHTYANRARALSQLLAKLVNENSGR